MTIWTVVLLMFLTLILGVGGWLLFMWGVKSGQFDDMQGPAHSILMDDDSPDTSNTPNEEPGTQTQKEDKNGNV